MRGRSALDIDPAIIEWATFATTVVVVSGNLVIARGEALYDSYWPALLFENSITLKVQHENISASPQEIDGPLRLRIRGNQVLVLQDFDSSH